MELSLNEAINLYNHWPSTFRNPYFNPRYVYADSLREEGLRPIFYLYKDGSDFFYYSFHYSYIEELDVADIQSAYGYGGPLATTEDKGFLQSAWADFHTWANNNNVTAEFIRFHPLENNWRFYTGDIFFERETVFIPLDFKNIDESIKPRKRTAIRKTLNQGIRVEWCEDQEYFLNHFIPLYYQLMNKRGADRFYYFNHQYFQELCAMENVFKILAYSGEEVLGAAIFLMRGQDGEYHLGTSIYNSAVADVLSVMIYEACKLLAQKGVKRLHLGGGLDNSSKDPLFFYKSRFSNLRGEFKIGRRVFNQAKYDSLKDEWLKNGRDTSRILFYRF